MSLFVVKERIVKATGFGVGQVTDWIEVIRLKLRIIGFSNKLSGLYGRLGESAYNSLDDLENFHNDEKAARLIEDIKTARKEIEVAEESIGQRQSDSANERKLFLGKEDETKVSIETPDAEPESEENDESKEYTKQEEG